MWKLEYSLPLNPELDRVCGPKILLHPKPEASLTTDTRIKECSKRDASL